MSSDNEILECCLKKYKSCSDNEHSLQESLDNCDEFFQEFKKSGKDPGGNNSINISKVYRKNKDRDSKFFLKTKNKLKYNKCVITKTKRRN